jgi:hypothetical protein
MAQYLPNVNLQVPFVRFVIEVIKLGDLDHDFSTQSLTNSQVACSHRTDTSQSLTFPRHPSHLISLAVFNMVGCAYLLHDG